MIYSLMGEGYESNCFLVVDEEAALIDSGNPSRVFKKIDELGIGINHLIISHCHYDHIIGLPEVKDKTGGLVAVHELDAEAIEEGYGDRILCDLFGVDCPRLHVDVRLREGDSINLGDTVLQVLHTPGHTPGSISLYEPESKSLFSGDTFFADGIGRTDLPGGSVGDLKKSMEKLIKLHHDSGINTVYPGHGPLGRGEDVERVYGMYFGK